MTWLPPLISPGNEKHPAYHYYKAWADHWMQCEHCHQHSWMHPGMPLAHEKPDPPWTKTIKWKKNEVEYEVHYSPSDDPSVLCQDGKILFRKWEAAATQ